RDAVVAPIPRPASTKRAVFPYLETSSAVSAADLYLQEEAM
ncbi:unnamed protein product, partial [marine sediment metagenome]